MAILNLDIFEEKIHEIQIKGKIYKIPSDIPTFLYLELLEANQDGNIDNMKKGLKVMHKIFQILQPKLSYEDFGMIISANKYAAIINYLFADMSAEETIKLLEETKIEIKDGKKKPPQVES